jgi:hypothetical protein
VGVWYFVKTGWVFGILKKKSKKKPKKKCHPNTPIIKGVFG